MGTLQIGAEDGVVNTTVTTENSGPNGGAGELGSGTVSPFYYWNSSVAFNGAMGYRGYFGSPTAVYALAAQTIVAQAASATNSVRTRFYFRYSVLPATNLTFFRIMRNSNVRQIIEVQFQTDGSLVVRTGDSSAAGNPMFVSGFITKPNTWYRLELCVKPSNTNAANSSFGFACGAADAVFTASNTASQAYYYTTAANMWGLSTYTAAPGIGSVEIGAFHMLGATTHTWGPDATGAAAELWVDDIAYDNATTWTSAPSTWWGKSKKNWADIVSGRAVPTASFDGSSVKVWSDVFTPSAIPALGVAASPIQKSGLILASAAPRITPNSADVSHKYPLSAAVAAALALNAQQPSRNYSLPVSAVAGMILTAAGLQKSASLAAGAAAALALAGFRGSSAAVDPMGATASALYGSKIDVLGLLGVMGAEGSLGTAMDILWQDFFFGDAVASMDLGSLRVASPGLAVQATPKLVLPPDISRSVGWSSKAVPLLTLAGRKDLTPGAVVARAAVALVLAGRLTITQALQMSIIARMIHFGATIGEVRTYDEVLARIISQGGSARLFERGAIVELLENGMRLADVLGGPYQARPLPGGMLAIILD